MQVSVSTGCLHIYPPDRIADIALEAGFGHVEVLLNEDVLREIDAMARALSSRGLCATVVHAPFALDGILSDPERQGEALILGKRALDAALAVGASALTLHPGAGAPRGFSKEAADGYEEMARRNIDALQTMAAARQVELLVENTSARYILGIKVSGLLGNDPEEMARFLGPVDAPLRRMTFDTSHASTLRRTPIDAFIRRMGSRIASVHLSDSNRWIDHLPIGYGRIDFRKVFDALRAIGFDGNVTLEFRPRHSTPTELRRNRVLVETELAPRVPRS